MGARNALTAFHRFPALSHRAARALAFMALVALDDPHGNQPARVYWGGHDELAAALGWCRFGERAYPWARREARRVIAELVTVGAVKSEGTAHGGDRQRYRLNLDAEPPDAAHK